MSEKKRDRREYSKKRYAENKDRLKAEKVEISRTKNGMIGIIYQSQKQSASRRGHNPPSYSMDELREWFHSQDNFDNLYNDWVGSGYKKHMKPRVPLISI